MKLRIFLIFPIILLTGCTDIRERRLPDVLAVDTGSPVRFAAHFTQDETVITAAADTVLQMPDALQNEAGTEISTGHLTMLAVSGNPCPVIEQYLQAQDLAPTCLVLSVPRSACAMLKHETLPAPEAIQAACDTGMLPCRTADAVIGDLWGGSGITALPVYKNSALTLALWDAEQDFGTLSQDACRGLALFGSRWKSFSFSADGSCFRLTNCRLGIKLHRTQDHLQITVSGNLSGKPPLTAAASGRISEMLRAAVTETAIENGADVLFLKEAAHRDGAVAVECTQQEWREMLKTAECSIMFGSG